MTSYLDEGGQNVHVDNLVVMVSSFCDRFVVFIDFFFLFLMEVQSSEI